MEIRPDLAADAIRQALEKYPQFAANGPRIAVRELFQGHAFLLEYDTPPARDDADAWEFQNAAVKAYRRMAGV